MQQECNVRKVIAVAYTMRNLGGFVNKNRCLSVRLVSEEV